MDTRKLDNPCWHALNETHSKFALDFPGMKFYHPEYCLFGAIGDPKECAAGMDDYSGLVNNFYVIGEQPEIPKGIRLIKELVCLQMVLESPIQVSTPREIMPLNTLSQKTDLYTLVNRVQPGYFMKKTSALGTYYGIYQDQQLVAVTGERMTMDQYVEISAVVTHPDHTGKGYAKQLVAHACQAVFEQNKIPYLHVALSNTGAIRLYEKLGFKTRRTISFWNFSGIE